MYKRYLWERVGFFILLLQFYSCYCYEHIRGRSSVRYLTVARSVILCPPLPHNAEERSVMGTVYNGQINGMQSRYQNMYNLNAPGSVEVYSSFLVGIRAEKFLNPFQKPVPTLVLGFDYSYAENRLQIRTISNTAEQKFFPLVQHHRLYASANYVTWVKHWLIGYITMQSGIEFLKSEQNRPSGSLLFTDQKINGRIGYGLHLFPYRKTAINIEAGWGGGAWLRMGFSRFLF